MNCNEAKDRWRRRFDEGRSDHDLDVHLADCPACRQYAAQMHQLCDALDALRDETERVASPAARARPRRAFRWLAAAAAVALASLVYWSATSTRLGSPPTAPQAAIEPLGVPSPPLGITLQGESRDQLLVVAVASVPEVPIYRLYPRLRAVEAGRQQIEESR